MIKDFATLDFETYYDSEYSLSKLQTDEYVLDPRFEIMGVSVKPSTSQPTEFFSSYRLEDYREYLRDAIDWKNTPVCAHHTHFDGFICTQKLGLEPKLWMDTVSMARTVRPWLKSYALGAVAEEFGLGHKGGAVHNMKGRTLASLSPQELAAYGDYCQNDTALTHSLAQICLQSGFTFFECVLADLTIRMFTEPTLHGDIPKLVAYHQNELDKKQALMESITADKDTLMSNPKFAEALEKLGVQPPTKMSPRTNKVAYAFAKTDKAFKALLEHPNPDVQRLVAARLGVKTTIAETRALRLIEAARRGPLPVYLHHWGAKVTGRLSGGNKMNYQNMPGRGEGKEIRKCLIAPPGYSVVVGDSSNIELRVGMVLAGETEAVARLYRGEDLYCVFATELFGRPITKADKRERMLGKVAMLSLQYGTGAAKFIEMARIIAGESLTEEESQQIVDLYRRTYKKLKSLWYYCGDTVLPAIRGMRLLTPVDVNGWFLTTENGFALPGQPGVCYYDLHKDSTGDWVYTQGRATSYIHGAKVVENLCQHAARQIVMWQTARFARKYPVALSVHDEIVSVVPTEAAEACKAYMLECLSTAPAWCAGQIPLEGEAAIGPSYGEAKN